MMHARAQEWDPEGEARAKRRRSAATTPSHPASGAWETNPNHHEHHEHHHAPPVNQSADRDCYSEVLQGPALGAVRNTWLNDVRSVSSGQGPPAGTGPSPHELRSLSQQLLQVKRRLWPAAERCAHALHDPSTTTQDVFSHARRLCNPMEPLGEGRARGLNSMFMNRSAIKLANLDAILGFRLSRPSPGSGQGSPLWFVDLCGAPGGFSEYLLRRVQHDRSVASCRGYGLSLVGPNEHGNGTPWKLQPSTENDGQVQTVYRISGGSDGTGDIYRWENTEALWSGIQHDLQAAGLAPGKVHLVVADGGFDAQRDSECQEELAQKLVLCEMAAGLRLLRPGGTFVVKMFGFRTSTMRTAMRSLSDVFDEISVLKPISSRPASSERYVVFAGFRGVAPEWDGPSWLNKVFLDRAITRPASAYAGLDRYLDEMDRDMLSLNLKACFAILSCLERQISLLQSRPHQPHDWWEEEPPPVNVYAYKAAWRLE